MQDSVPPDAPDDPWRLHRYSSIKPILAKPGRLQQRNANNSDGIHHNVLPSTSWLGSTPSRESLGLSLLGAPGFQPPGSQKLVLWAPWVSPSWKLAREMACAPLSCGILQAHHSPSPQRGSSRWLVRYLRVKGVVHKGHLHNVGQFPTEVHTYAHRHSRGTSAWLWRSAPHSSFPQPHSLNFTEKTRVTEWKS